MNDFAANLVVALLRTTVLLAGAAVLVRLLLWAARSSSPAIHRVAWCLVLLQGWLFLRLPVAIPYHEAPPSPPQWADGPPVDDRVPSEMGTVASASASASNSSTLQPASSAGEPEPPSPDQAGIPTAQPPPAANRWSWPLAVTAVWLTGMGILIAGSLTSYLRFLLRLPPGQPADESWARQWEDLLAQRGIRRKIPLRVTASLGPLLCRLPGGYRLFIPAKLWQSLAPAERLAVLRHELAHYERGDNWKSLAVRLLALPHWFNPFAWWAVRRFDECAEWACDRRAIDTEPARATDYVRVLLRLGEATHHPSYSRAARGHGLAVRIRRLLTPHPLEDSVMKKGLVITVTLALVVLCLVRFDLVAKDPERAKDRSPAKSEPAARESVTKESLRYDGKSFAEWKNELLTELKPERRTEAIKAFAAFGTRGYAEEATRAIVELMRENPSWVITDSAMGRLNRAAFEAFKPTEHQPDKITRPIHPAAVVPILSGELKRGNRNSRFFAACALRDIGSEAKPALPALMEVVRGEGDSLVHAVAFSAVAAIDEGGEEIATALRDMFKAGDLAVIESALSVLVPFNSNIPGGRPGGGSTLFKPRVRYDSQPMTLVLDEVPEGRLAPKAQPVVKVLIQAIGDERPAVRLPAIRALGRIGPEAKEAVPTLIRAFEKSDRGDRSYAADALAGIGPAGRKIIPALIETFEKGERTDRYWVAAVFATFGPVAKEAIPVLKEAIGDEDEGVRRAAEAALQAISALEPLPRARTNQRQGGKSAP